MQLHMEAWKVQGFSGLEPVSYAIPVRRLNQLSFEATDVGNWSFVGSNELVRNECEMMYEKLISDIEFNLLLVVTGATAEMKK